MREKILARLKALFPGVNLSKTRLDAIADKLAAKITDENEIDNQLNLLNDVLPFADIAKDDDRIRTLEAKNKTKVEPQNQQPGTNPATTEPAKEEDDTTKLLKTLLEKVTKLETEKSQSTIQQKLSVHDKLKNVPASFWNKRVLPEKEEDIETFVTEVETDYTSFKQDLTDKGLMSQTPPGGGGVTSTSSSEVEKDIEAWASKGSTTEVKK